MSQSHRWEISVNSMSQSPEKTMYNVLENHLKKYIFSAFVVYPKTGTAHNAGPAPYRAAGSLSSADGESTDTPVRGKPSEAGTRGVLPTHSDVCLQRPALPAAGLNWSSEPK